MDSSERSARKVTRETLSLDVRLLCWRTGPGPEGTAAALELPPGLHGQTETVVSEVEGFDWRAKQKARERRKQARERFENWVEALWRASTQERRRFARWVGVDEEHTRTKQDIRELALAAERKARL